MRYFFMHPKTLKVCTIESGSSLWEDHRNKADFIVVKEVGPAMEHWQEAMDSWQKLKDIPPGSIFETTDGVRAVKSEYYYSGGQCQCILLASGEYAHFKNGNSELVKVQE